MEKPLKLQLQGIDENKNLKMVHLGLPKMTLELPKMEARDTQIERKFNMIAKV